MTSEPIVEHPPVAHCRVVTNMAFWQSAYWCNHVDSIYDLAARPISMISSFREALKLFGRRHSYDVVLTMGSRCSLLYGLLCALARADSKQIMTEVFIDPPKQGGRHRIKSQCFRYIARRSLGILTNSSHEVSSIAQRFDVPQDRLRFVPLHTTIQEPRVVDRDDGYILSAGRSQRDYVTLFSAAERIDTPIIVVAGKGALPRVNKPRNITFYYDVPRDEYLRLLEACSMLVLPLHPTDRSSGQVVMLEAMSLGKPVIATACGGTIDYLEDQETGLLIPPHDEEAIVAAVQCLQANPEKGRSLAQHALSTVNLNYGIDKHARAKLKAIGELAQISVATP